MNPATTFDNRPPLFTLGKLLIADSVQSVVDDHEIQLALRRHVRGDWGDIDHRCGLRNKTALADGGIVESLYVAAEGHRFKVVTEPDRSFTCVLPAGEE